MTKGFSKFVKFEGKCQKCKNNVPDNEKCEECQSTPARDVSHTPIHYEPKEGAE